MTKDTNPEKTLLALGAEAVTGRLYLNRTFVGAYTSGGLELTEAGRIAVATAELPEVKAEAPKKPAARKTTKPAEPPATPTPEPAPADASVDDLLAGVDLENLGK